jgi:CBS domain-containing protein
MPARPEVSKGGPGKTKLTAHWGARMQVHELLDGSSRQVLRVPHSVTVADAVQLMFDRKSTVLIVVDGEEPLGIFTERDLLRCCAQHQLDSLARLPISRAMSNKLIVAKPEDDLLAAFSMMIQTNIRHLPVGDGPAIVAILPIHEVARHLVSVLSQELSYLQDYIANHLDAATD